MKSSSPIHPGFGIDAKAFGDARPKFGVHALVCPHRRFPRLTLAALLLLISAALTFRAYADDTVSSNLPPTDFAPVPPLAAVTNSQSPPPAATPDSQAPPPAANISDTSPATSTNVDSGVLSDTPPTGQPAADTAAPEPGQLPTPGVASPDAVTPVDQAKAFQAQLDLARQQRISKDTVQATQILTSLIGSAASDQIKRSALFELALVAQDDNHLVKAEQIFGQYLHLYPDDPTDPEVLLRQGLIYRQMGVTSLAISKFYAVMSTSLRLKLDNMDYYRKLVLQAQIEIADTYYLEGRYIEASDYFTRLLKNPPADLDQAQIQYKLIRSLSALTNSAETVARAQVFLDDYTNSLDVPEVRFLLAASLKKLGRNQESLRQVLLLLQTERENVDKSPELWAYWQRRAGNEIASQLFKEGDYLDALQINITLADLDKSPAWQLPVWYQTALIYEQLEQWQKASDTYQRILDRHDELAASDAAPSLISLSEMAKWRKDYIAWQEKAKIANLTYERRGTNSLPGGVAAAP
jgi:tetratricopeptide (TPR) repeat protein